MTSKPNRGCTPHLIAILVITIILLIIAKFTFRGLPERLPSSLPSDTQTPLQTPTISSNSWVDISLLPKTSTGSPNMPFMVKIFADSHQSLTTFLDLYVGFDKNKLSVESASPSAFFPNQVIFASTIDRDKGLIHLSFGSLSPATGSGTIAVLSGHIGPLATGSAQISILPESRAGGVGTNKSVLGHIQNAEFIITSY